MGKPGLVAIIYLALVLHQVVWHALLPAPLGAQSWILAALATLPLLFPLRGVLSGSRRSMTWGGYLLVFYLAVGVMEAWSNPPQRIPAMLQTGLVALYIFSLVRAS
jgi:uncharacterized membrane protein